MDSSHDITRLPISDERFRQLVVLDLKEQSTPQQEATLREDVDRWYAALRALVQESQQVHTKRKAALLEAKRECLREGPSGYQRYLECEAHTKRQQAATQSFLTRALNRLREVKALRHQQHQAAQMEERARYLESTRFQQEAQANRTALDQERSQSTLLLLAAHALISRITTEPNGLPVACREDASHWLAAYAQWQHSHAARPLTPPGCSAP